MQTSSPIGRDMEFRCVLRTSKIQKTGLRAEVLKISDFKNHNLPGASINFHFIENYSQILPLILSHQLELSFTPWYFKTEKV